MNITTSSLNYYGTSGAIFPQLNPLSRCTNLQWGVGAKGRSVDHRLLSGNRSAVAAFSPFVNILIQGCSSKLLGHQNGNNMRTFGCRLSKPQVSLPRSCAEYLCHWVGVNLQLNGSWVQNADFRLVANGGSTGKFNIFYNLVLTQTKGISISQGGQWLTQSGNTTLTMNGQDNTGKIRPSNSNDS